MIPTSLILISAILQYKSIHEVLYHYLQEIQRRPVLKWPLSVFGDCPPSVSIDDEYNDPPEASTNLYLRETKKGCSAE